MPVIVFFSSYTLDNISKYVVYIFPFFASQEAQNVAETAFDVSQLPLLRRESNDLLAAYCCSASLVCHIDVLLFLSSIFVGGRKDRMEPNRTYVPFFFFAEEIPLTH